MYARSTGKLNSNPHILILDEVTSGLDPVSRETVLDELMEFMQNPENSILITSHITTDLEKIADYIAVIDDGRILLAEEKDKLLYEYGIARLDRSQEDYIRDSRMYAYKESGGHINALIKDKSAFLKKHPDVMVNKPSIEEVAIIIIKGDRNGGIDN